MRFVQDELGRSVFGFDCTHQADSVVEGKATMERDRSAGQQRLAAQSLSRSASFSSRNMHPVRWACTETSGFGEGFA